MAGVIARVCEGANLGVFDLRHSVTYSNAAVRIRVGLELAELRA